MARSVGDMWVKPGVDRRATTRCYWAKDKACQHNYRARVIGAVGVITGPFVATQWTAQGGCCFWCDIPLARPNSDDVWTLDHLVPYCKGGQNEPANVVIACGKCNARKGKSLPLDWRAPKLAA